MAANVVVPDALILGVTGGYNATEIFPLAFVGVYLLFWLVLMAVIVAAYVVGIWAVIDAARRPDYQFAATGENKVMWIILPALGLVTCQPVALVGGLIFLLKIRKKLDAVPAPPAGWYGYGAAPQPGWYGQGPSTPPGYAPPGYAPPGYGMAPGWGSPQPGTSPSHPFPVAPPITGDVRSPMPPGAGSGPGGPGGDPAAPSHVEPESRAVTGQAQDRRADTDVTVSTEEGSTATVERPPAATPPGEAGTTT